MGFFSLLFSPKGRVARLTFIAVALGCHLSIYLLTRGLPAALNAPLYDTQVLVISGVLSLLLLWPLYCVCAKRLHDLNRTALWALPLLLNPALAMLFTFFMAPAILANGPVPPDWYWTIKWPQMILGGYVLLLQAALAVWPGSKGPNRFGTSPKGKALPVDGVFE